MRSCMVLKYIKRDEYDEENFRKSVIDNIVTQLRGDDPLQLGADGWIYNTKRQTGEFFDGKMDPAEIRSAVNNWNAHFISRFTYFLKYVREYSGSEEDLVREFTESSDMRSGGIPLWDVKNALMALCGETHFGTTAIFINDCGCCHSNISKREKEQILEHTENYVLCEIYYDFE